MVFSRLGRHRADSKANLDRNAQGAFSAPSVVINLDDASGGATDWPPHRFPDTSAAQYHGLRAPAGAQLRGYSMELTTGLYIAYELVKGVGIIAGADQQLVGLADRFTAISKLLPKPPGDNPTADPTNGTASTASAAQEVGRVSSLLMLLAHSRVTLDLAQLRSAVTDADGPLLIGDVAFVFEKPLALGDLPLVANFNSLRKASVTWDPAAQRFHFDGISDPTPRPRPPSSVTLDSALSKYEIALPTRKGILRLSFLSLKRTTAAPISWDQPLPSVRITYSDANNKRTLAEIVAP